MEQELYGSLFPATLAPNSILPEALDGRNSIALRTEAALYLFDRLGVLAGDVEMTNLMLLQRLVIGQDLKARFMSFRSNSYGLFSNRKNGCSWNPKGKLRPQIEAIDTCAIEFNGEICPDAFWDNCMEQLFGVGNERRNLYSTPESTALVAAILRRVFVDLGNSFHQLFWASNHPLINSANTKGYWINTTNAENWADYLDQQTSIDCDGILTILDKLATDGVPGFSNEIPDADFTPDGRTYRGDIIGLLNSIIAEARGPLASATLNGYTTENGVRIKPTILLTAALYNEYQNYLNSTYTANPSAWQFVLTGTDGTGAITMPGVLQYNGHPVKRWDASNVLDTILGTTCHRAALVLPGAMGYALDIPSLNQYRGMGLQILQRLEPPYMGKLFMHTTFRLGMGITDSEAMVYRSNLREPS